LEGQSSYLFNYEARPLNESNPINISLSLFNTTKKIYLLEKKNHIIYGCGAMLYGSYLNAKVYLFFKNFH